MQLHGAPALTNGSLYFRFIVDQVLNEDTENVLFCSLALFYGHHKRKISFVNMSQFQSAENQNKTRKNLYLVRTLQIFDSSQICGL